MKKILLILIMFSSLFLMSFQIGKKPNPEINKKVKEVLSKMSLEEKVGQMTQVAIGVVSKPNNGQIDKHEIDPVKLEEAILKYHVGSILNVEGSAYSLSHWHEIISSIQDVATKKSRLKIPILYGIDAVHGANYTRDATVFPQAIAQAAAWDQDLCRKIGEVTAVEVRASGIPWNFYPVMDIGRNPLWPRLWETFGEDVYLASLLGKEYIVGQQGDNYGAEDKIATCLKHYVGYGYPLNGKDRTPAWIPERILREYFLPPFEAGIEAGAPTVMANSSENNGIPVHSDKFLLTDLLRNELKFKGFVVSDWEDIKRLYSRDRVADSPKEAVRMAVMAGVDMSMVPSDFSFYDYLLELVKEGSVPVSRIDEAVTEILKLKFELGLFENPYPNKKLVSKFACKEYTDFNLDVAREVMTLLKNDKNVLPLDKKLKVLVTGPTANSLSMFNSGWTITWQGDVEALYPKNKLTVLQAIQEKIGKTNVTYVPGVAIDKEIDIKAAIDAAKSVDAAIVCLGEKAYCETPGNLDDLTLEKSQLNLIEELSKTGKPIILVLIEGRPRLINNIIDKVNSIVLAYLPGMEGGKALADVIFGDFNPCGKLPYTYPKYPNALVPYDHKPLEVADVNKYDPQFPFGFGLSYTSFEYRDLNLSKNVINKNDEIKISVQVKNKGKRTGKEVVQLYLTDLYGSVSRPVKMLRRFSKINLEPGQEKKVEFVLQQKDLSFFGRDNKRIIEPGEFKITIDTLTKSFNLK
jgi:beta-glucosidase